jgi:hypothetical protein
MENTTIDSTVTIKARKQGSGRTKGSFSFVKITLAELNSKFADQSTPMVVSRKWAETCGFTGLVANPANSTFDAIQGQTPDTKVAAVVTDLDE